VNDFESIDDMLEYISDNTDTILKNVDYDSNDPEGIKKELEMLNEKRNKKKCAQMLKCRE